MNSDFVQIEFDGDLELIELDEQDGPSRPGREERATYTGPEKRYRQRRQCSDRREQFRFNAGKDDRRSGNDQRRHGWEWKYTI